jgi:acetoacetate decarboxylase
MGFPKRLGQIFMSEPHPLNPVMGPIETGTKLKGYVTAHGERLIEGTMLVRGKIDPATLPYPLRAPLFHIRHFPSIEAGAPPSVLELVELPAQNVRLGKEAWHGVGNLAFFPSDLEEHMSLAPIEILGGYRFSSGYTFAGGKVLHRWV